MLTKTAYSQIDETVLTLEEIVVTGRKREESLQEAPLSITALTKDDIERAGIASLDDVAALSPGLTFNSYGGGNFATPTIRGQAQTDITNIENNVSVFLNGIYLSNKSSLDLSLLDLEQIEVIRGAQSALYGRNSFAGSINYNTAKPRDEFEGSVEAGLGSDSKRDLTAVLNIPLSDNISTRIAASFSEFDGTIKNSADSSDNLGGYEKTSFAASVLMTPSDALEMNAFIFYNDQQNDHVPVIEVNNNCASGVNIFGTIAPINSSFCGDLPSSSSADIDPRAYGSEKESLLIGFSFDYRLGNGVLSGLLGYSNSESEDLADNDFTSQGTDYRIFNFTQVPFPPFVVPIDTGNTTNLATFTGSQFENEDQSIELRYRSDQDRSWRWMVGAFYSDTELLEVLNQSVVGVPLAFPDVAFVPGPIRSDPRNLTDLFVSEFDLSTQAVFGEVAVDFSDKLTGTLELRYSKEEREANLVTTVINGFPGQGAGRLSEDYDFVTPRMIIDYQMNSDTLIYGSVTKGVKAGGFNNSDPNVVADLTELSYDEESNTSFELGYKKSFGDGRYQMNLAAYYIDWEDLQIRSFGPASVAIIQNAGDAKVTGAELSLKAALTENFVANLGYSYTNPEYDSDVTSTSGRRECGVPERICQRAANGEAIIGGNQLARTSEHQLNVTGTYNWVINDTWNAFLRADYLYQSEQPNEINQNAIEARSLVNARLGIESDRYQIEFWAKNLTDEEYVRSQIFFNLPDAFPVFSYKAILGDTRTFGVTAKMNF